MLDVCLFISCRLISPHRAWVTIFLLRSNVLKEGGGQRAAGLGPSCSRGAAALYRVRGPIGNTAPWHLSMLACSRRSTPNPIFPRVLHNLSQRGAKPATADGVCSNHDVSAAYTHRTWRPSENYLVRFAGEQLSDPDLLKIWKAYDSTGDGNMDREELAFLMEDLCEVRRHVWLLRGGR